MSWCLESNRNLPLPRALDIHAFEDAAGMMGTAAYDLGNVYKAVGPIIHNRSALFSVLVPTSTHTDPMEGITPQGLEAAEAAIDSAMRNVHASKIQTADAHLIKSEFENAAAMLRFACRKARGEDPKEQLKQIIQNHRQCWLSRNRPGGLADSISRLR